MSKLMSLMPEEEHGVPMLHVQCALGGAPQLAFLFTLLHLNIANAVNEKTLVKTTLNNVEVLFSVDSGSSVVQPL